MYCSLTWVASAEVCLRCGGRGEGVREGWECESAVRRVESWNIGVSWEEVLSRRMGGSQCSDGSGGGGFEDCVEGWCGWGS